MVNDEALIAHLLTRMAEILQRYGREEEKLKVLSKPLPASQLRSLFDQHMALPEQGAKDKAGSDTEAAEDILGLVETILQHSARTVSPRFMDKLYAGSDAIGQIAELVIAVLNTNVHVYSVSPVATLMEHACIHALSEAVGFATPCSGVFSPGGSASNLLAMTTARNTLFPDLKRLGAARSGQLLTVFTSVEAHYSIQKSAIVMGLGSDSVVAIPVNAAGYGGSGVGGGVDPAELRNLIQQSAGLGETPFFINLTAGTTVLSSFDPIQECVAAVRALEVELGRKIWIHVDGSYGGPVIFSNKWKERLFRGIEQVDSITLNPHKILGVPQQCSVLLVNSDRWGRKVLWEANGLRADYLFHDSETSPGSPTAPSVREGEEDNGFMMDMGDATIGCGRKADAVKLFICWTFHGTQGWARRVDKALENVDTLARLFASSKQFQLVIPFSKESQDEIYGGGRLTVGVWCIPQALQSRYGQLQEFMNQAKNPKSSAHVLLKRITKLVHVELTRRGRFMIDFMGLKWQNLPDFIRVAVSSDRIDNALLHELFNELEGIVSRVEVVDFEQGIVSLREE
ncbi:hypothetical protein HDU77_008664 [Chytriomyces hyalinus]|nr:hypothetical protein HDU77_008664 [Chytriomyces hyalinus]